MAVAAPARRMTPLTLRDFLEQSSSEGFRAYPRFPVADEGVAGGDLAPPVRLLIEAGLRRSPSRLPSFYNFFHKSPGTLAKISRLSRSLSRRFRDGLWRRRGEDDGEEDDDIAVDERDSLGLPSPVVSSCSSSECEYMAESEAELAKTEEEKCASASEYEKTSQSSTGSVAFHGAADAGGDGHKVSVNAASIIVRLVSWDGINTMVIDHDAHAYMLWAKIIHATVRLSRLNLYHEQKCKYLSLFTSFFLIIRH
jgi:hypothetical protein